MLKKMRRRFILAAMLAFTAVMVILAAGINLLNYYQTAAARERTMDGILEYEEVRAELPDQSPPPINEMDWVEDPASEFTERFFAVRCDRDGNIRIFGNEYISSIDEAAADEYTRAVLDSHEDQGRYGDYHYRITEDGDEFIIIFLNTASSDRFCRTLLAASAAIVLLCLAIVLILVILFSGTAMRPFARNIERQKRFITDAGHELKTPITSITTSADILAMEDPESEWIRNIQQQSLRLSHLTADLVTLSRLDEDVPLPEKQIFSLSDAAWETAESFSPQLRAAGKQYTQEIEGGLEYHGEKASIQKLLSILLDNAIKYSDAGGRVSLKVCHRRGKGRRVMIEVFNTCDLDPEIDLDRLFDRFYRPDQSRSVNTGGSGIGLAIAREIAEAHGGEITASAPDRRSILFRVTL